MTDRELLEAAARAAGIPLFVRCVDRTVFRVERRTLDAITTAHYDPWCYTEPRNDVEYIEHAEWCRVRAAARGAK